MICFLRLAYLKLEAPRAAVIGALSREACRFSDAIGSRHTQTCIDYLIFMR